MSETTKHGYVFKPALQDISLKRFRMRYSTAHDCYYLHWDNTLCRQLARIEGLENGVFSMSGLERYQDDSEGKAFLGCERDSTLGEVKWKLDFSKCGLVVNKIHIQAEWWDRSERVWFEVTGDESVTCYPFIGARAMEIPQLHGCKTVTLAAMIQQDPGTDLVQLLLGSHDQGDCSLDISVDLMCARHKDSLFVGQLLLGLKFTPESSENSSGDASDTSLDSMGNPGQLQVHIVEGAGIVDEENFKPFNTVVKCHLLPDTGRYSSKETSPRHNAYPTWTKEFVFPGVSREELVQGGLDVILYDHHFFSNSNIGGIRLSVPQKNNRSRLLLASPDVSPANSRSSSPEILPEGEGLSTPNDTPTFPQSPLVIRKDKALSLPTAYLTTESPSNSPILLRRARSPSPSTNTLSPNLSKRSRSPSPTRTSNSPIAVAKHLFRTSGSHLKELASPHSSPIPGRKKFRGSPKHGRNHVESEYLYWWMDSSGDEVSHWQQILDNEGEWVYYWHTLRPKMKSGSS